MAGRQLTFRVGLIAIPLLAVMAGVLVWAKWGDPVRFSMEDAPDEPRRARKEKDEPSRPEPAVLEASKAAPGASTVSGVVLEPSGDPAAGVEVLILAEETWEDADPLVLRRDIEARLASSLRATAAEDGRFEIGGIHGGPFRVIARSDTALPGVSEAIHLDGETAPGPVEVRLEAAAALRGIVIASGGDPVQDARVEISFAGGPRDAAPGGVEDVLRWALARHRASTRTDAAGRFEATGLLAGYHDLDVLADGFGAASVADAPAGEEPIRIVLRPELFIRGEVLDASGAPLEGAEVRVDRLADDAAETPSVRPGSPGVVVRSGKDGKFAVGGLSRGVYRLEAAHPGHQGAEAPFVALHESGSPAESYVVFRLEKGHSIRGVVRGVEAKPLANAEVRAHWAPPELDPEADVVGGVPPARIVRSGQDGTFEVTGLTEAVHRLQVSAVGHRDRWVEGVPVGASVEIALVPSEPVSGVVLDGRSRDPLPGAVVSLREVSDAGEAAFQAESRVVTDREGKFRVERRTEGRRALVVEAEGYQDLATPPLDGDGGDGELVIALDRGGAVSGRVRGPPGPSPMGLRVRLLSVPEKLDELLRSDERREGSALPVGPQGDYRLPIPRPGTYHVLAEGRPFVPVLSRRIEVSDPRADVEGVDIDLELAATLRGRVEDATSFPVAGAQAILVLSREGGEQSWSVRTDATGAFEVEGLRPGAYRAIASAPGFIRGRSEPLELTAGAERAVIIVLEPEMAISGSVSSPEGDPIAAAEIRAVEREAETRDAFSEERTVSSTPGTFRLGRLGNRRYDLRVIATGFAPALIEDVAAGRSDVHLRLERPVSVSGRVIGAFTGDAVTAFRLRLLPEAAERLPEVERDAAAPWREFIDPAGAFSIDGITPGLYQVEVDAPGHLAIDPQLLALPAGEKLDGVEIPVPERGLLAGVVHDGAARPLAGARVHALQRVADPETGRFRYRPISSWSSDGRSGRRERGERGDRGGRKGGGKDDDDRPRYPSRPVTGEDGRFWLRGLPDGVYRIGAAHDEFVAGETGDLILEEGAGGEGTVAVMVYLDPGATLRGSVRWLSSVEGGQLSVSLSPAGAAEASPWRGSGRKSARVDSTGGFEIRGLAVGEYVLSARYRRARDGGAESFRRTVEIQEPVREKKVIVELGR